MTNDEYIAETIRGALAGNAVDGIEALSLCRNGLEHNNLHADLRFYLAERITELLEGTQPHLALRIAKPPGRPKDSFPAWQQELGAFAALLTLRGYMPQQIAVAMCDQRAALHDKPLEESDAHAIRKTWKAMQNFKATKGSSIEERLEHLAGSYREILSEYPPRKTC